MTNHTTTKRFMTMEELSEYLDIPSGTLYAWRHRNYGPPAHKFGGAIRFAVEDVDEWAQGTREHVE